MSRDRVPPPGRWARQLVRGREDDAAWVRPSLIGLLGVAALLYLWDLGASGWANAFYSAAVQAGSTSWKAFFFGSFDASNFITVDKSPASLWVMDISARIFGVNAWSILVPQALEGVATVGFTYLTVRRWFSPAAAIIAGATVALTPVAALMFRFDNPDALLVLLLTVATYATVRAIEAGKTRWLVLGATLIGFAFLTKMLQGFLVVPVFGLVYLVAAPVSVRRRIAQLAIAAVVMVAASGWWVAIVQLIPAADRPYIGGSQDNSLLNLIFGYNGFGRITGNETGSVGGTGAAGSMWGATGWDRLFNVSFGGQISWLLPAALILLVAGLAFTLRSARTDRTRAALLLWGGSLVVTAAVFSFAAGIIHPYYTVALAPSIGALIGIGSVLLWQRRSQVWARLSLAAALANHGGLVGDPAAAKRRIRARPCPCRGRDRHRRGDRRRRAAADPQPSRHCSGDRDRTGGGVRWSGRVHDQHHADTAQRRDPVGGAGGDRRSVRRACGRWRRRFRAPGRIQPARRSWHRRPRRAGCVRRRRFRRWGTRLEPRTRRRRGFGTR